MEKMSTMVFQTPKSLIAEAYRSASANFCNKIIGKNIKIVEFASIISHNNKAVVFNLAVAMAQIGKKVLLMDCDFYNPELHTLLGLSSEGVINCLESGRDFHEFIQQIDQSCLDILVSGYSTDNLKDFLMSESMKLLLSAVREEYDLVLLKVSPVLASANAALLGSLTDGMVLLLRAKEDRLEQAETAKLMLSQAGVNILGCIVDNADSHVD